MLSVIIEVIACERLSKPLCFTNPSSAVQTSGGSETLILATPGWETEGDGFFMSNKNQKICNTFDFSSKQKTRQPIHAFGRITLSFSS
jgi:hypothetical protein